MMFLVIKLRDLFGVYPLSWILSIFDTPKPKAIPNTPRQKENEPPLVARFAAEAGPTD